MNLKINLERKKFIDDVGKAIENLKEIWETWENLALGEDMLEKINKIHYDALVKLIRDTYKKIREGESIDQIEIFLFNSINNQKIGFIDETEELKKKKAPLII